MPAIQIPDLNNAQQDVAFIAAFATSSALTAMDRFGRSRRTLQGVDVALEEKVDAVEETKVGAIEAITEKVDNVEGVVVAAVNAAVGVTAESAASVEANRTAYEDRVYPGVYSSAPTVKPRSGLPSADGDRCVLLVGGIAYEHVRSGGGWLIPNVDGADFGLPSGSARVGYDGATIQDIADYARPLPTFASLRAYVSRAKAVRITAAGIAGLFQRDDADSTTPDNGGTVIVDTSGRRWKRLLDGGSATPAMFGLPLNSVNVDNTVALQALLDTRNFVFPDGFTSSCKTLYLRSNSIGYFKNARFTLLANQPSGTQVIMLGTAAGGMCRDSVFHGGIFDGNRSNQTANDNVGVAGGDGGLHGIHIHHAINVRWYGPQAVNCGTDGIIVWQRVTGPYAGTVVRDVHFYSPICDGNSRQGFSVIACSDMNFYDAVARNTGPTVLPEQPGKLPQSGIDIEGNVVSDFTNVKFYGTTVCTGNAGRGVMSHTPGNEVTAYFEDLRCSGNRAVDYQVIFYVKSGSGSNKITARSLRIDGGKGFNLSNDVSVTGDFANFFKADELYVEGSAIIGNKANINIGKLTARGAFTTTNTAPVHLLDETTGTIGEIRSENTETTSNSLALLMTGAGRIEIARAYTVGPRGASLVGASNKKIRHMECAGALLSYALRLTAGCEKNEIAMLMLGTLAADAAVSIENSNNNDVEVTWRAASRSAGSIAGTSAGNRCKVISDKTVAAAVFGFGAGTAGNYLHSSQVSNSTNTGIVTDAGSGNKVFGCWPLAVNSAS